jgi:hypothetical protein
MRGFPYVQEYRDNRGKMRRYFRRKGVRIALPGEPGSPEFQAAYSLALAGEKQPKSVGPTPTKGTIGALVATYYASAEFKVLRNSTKRTYKSVLEPLREAHGDKRVVKLERRHIKAEMAILADRPGAANKYLRYLRQLLEYGVELEWIASNPAMGIKKLKVPGDGFKEWPESLIEDSFTDLQNAPLPLDTKYQIRSFGACL